MQVDSSFTEGGLPSKLKTKLMVDANDIILVKKKNVLGKDGLKVSLEHDCYLCTSIISQLESIDFHMCSSY